MSQPVDVQPPSVVDPAQLVRIQATHRGFLYQHLYVARTLLLAAGADATAILVEGDEDLEILRPSRRVYVQVKVRAELLGWSDIEDALERFATYRALHETGAVAVIPNNPSRAQKYTLDPHLYAQRHLVECCFSRLKQFRRVATRFEKTARNYLAILHLAAAMLWMR